MKKELAIDSWERKDHFNFFKGFEEPFFGVTVDLDCTHAYAYSKENGVSFFLYYLHKSLKAANKIELFKYRIIDDKVMVFDKVNASPTIGRPNGTFAFGGMEYFEDFAEFEKSAKEVIEVVQNSTGLFPTGGGDNVIHYSSLPWIKFTSMSHARNFSNEDSCPKISFGKMTENAGRREMPVSIHVHHALMDGLHVGEYIDEFQRLRREG